MPSGYLHIIAFLLRFAHCWRTTDEATAATAATAAASAALGCLNDNTFSCLYRNVHILTGGECNRLDLRP